MSEENKDKISKYVVGFRFSDDLLDVVLLQKSHPEWQKGRMNGPGGKIEEGESAVAAMVREFEEETGLKTEPKEWRNYIGNSGKDTDGNMFDLAFFWSVGDVKGCETKTDEKVCRYSVENINPHRMDLIENLTWLIPLAIVEIRKLRFKEPPKVFIPEPEQVVIPLIPPPQLGTIGEGLELRAQTAPNGINPIPDLQPMTTEEYEQFLRNPLTLPHRIEPVQVDMPPAQETPPVQPPF